MPRLLADTTPLRVSPEFRRLWWGLGLANLGSQLSVVAVGLQVYAITRSTWAVGVLGLCAFVPLVVLGLYGGVLVDAYDRRRVALLASVGLWVVAIGIAAQAWLGVGSVTLLYALVAVQSAAFAVNSPARQAILPRLLPARLLPAALSLQTVAFSLAFTIGPLLGALLVATRGFGVAYSVDVVTFAFALWAIWRLPAMPPEPVDASLVDPSAPVHHRAGFASVVEGLRYLTTRPNVRATFVLDLAAMVLAQPRVLFPAAGAVILGGGATTTGILTAAVALGAVVAGVLSGPLGSVRAQGRAVVGAIVLWGGAVAGFGLVLVLAGRHAPTGVLAGAVVAAVALLALAGAADAVSSVFRQSILQSATPDAMRGRLQGVFIVVVAGGPRLGDLVGGGGSSWLGEGWTAVAGGVACIVVVLLVARAQPRFLAYDARHPEP